MSKLTITVCDMCEGQEPLTQPYHVATDTVVLDLCPDHAQRWKNLATAGTKRQVAPAQTSAEAVTGAKAAPKAAAKAAPAKKAAKKAAAKKAPAKKAAAKKGRATKLSGKKATPRRVAKKSAARTRGAATKTSQVLPAVDNSAVRAWARSNGIAVTARGPLKTDLIKQFLDAPVNSATARGRQPAATFSHQG